MPTKDELVLGVATHGEGDTLVHIVNPNKPASGLCGAPAAFAPRNPCAKANCSACAAVLQQRETGDDEDNPYRFYSDERLLLHIHWDSRAADEWARRDARE